MEPALGRQRPPVRASELLDIVTAVHLALAQEAEDRAADVAAARSPWP